MNNIPKQYTLELLKNTISIATITWQIEQYELEDYISCCETDNDTIFKLVFNQNSPNSTPSMRQRFNLEVYETFQTHRQLQSKLSQIAVIIHDSRYLPARLLGPHSDAPFVFPD